VRSNTRIARLGLTPRQRELTLLYLHYRCQSYSTRIYDWNGQQVREGFDHEAIASTGVLPQGFNTVEGAYLPIKFRKPTVPYPLPKLIVDKFTGLLFSEQRHPKICVNGDPDTEDWIGQIAKEGRLWANMILARSYGGSMGSVAVGFEFKDGKPRFEIHNPIWCKPEFYDTVSFEIKKFEKRYYYGEEELDEATGIIKTVNYWYRRIIDNKKDVTWRKVSVGEGDEPDWASIAPTETVEHGLGFVPVVWIQNLPVQDDIDGDSDCIGIYETVDAMNALRAQSHKGILANCDPTVVITTSEQALPEIRKGSDSALKLPPGGTAGYMEMTGGGIKAAEEEWAAYRQSALEIAQCVLENPDQAQKTATEINRTYESMHAKADVLREQYGEKGVKPLLEKTIRAARKLNEPRLDEAGSIQRRGVLLDPQITKQEDGSFMAKERKLGPSTKVELQWSPYCEPTPDETNSAVAATSKAKLAGLIDEEHAIKHVAAYFKVEDVGAMVKKIKAETQERQQEMEQMAMNKMREIGSEI
jgi:hypothetical protein